MSRPPNTREQRKQDKRKTRKPVHRDKYAQQMDERLAQLSERFASEERTNERRR